MPKLGMTMEKGKIVEWYKKVGDEIVEGDLLLSVETEKVTADVEAEVSGVLGEILVNANETVPCDTPIAVVVSKDDWAQRKPIEVPAVAEAKAAASKQPDAGVPAGVKIVQLTGRKKAIADNTLLAAQTMATFLQSVDTDVSALQALRAKLMPVIEKEAGVRIGLNDLLVKIVVWGLKQVPALNAHLQGYELRLFDYVNMSISVAAPEGLILPVVHHADKKSLPELSKSIRDITERAMQEKLTPEDIAGGTFTLNNVGPLGVEFGSAIISPPQVAILNIGKIVQKPVVRDGNIVVAPIMSIFVNVDHRATDGAISAEFLRKVKSAIEDPAIIGPWD
ncbi:MAG: 2-oxo acid dehydrogenase subunit E2 [Chloroflexi bacterium]|nr:2-oxo acid dehydrogenase subunit E2 [Chloroflexota bacterium]